MTDTVRSWTFVLDLPIAELNPNGNRPHWAALHRARNAYRDECIDEIAKVLARVTGRLRIEPPWPVAEVLVTGRVRVGHRGDRDRYRPVDVPNLIYAMKGAYDALKHCGVIVDDRYDRMILGAHRIEPVTTAEEEGITVVVRQGPEWRA